LIEIDDYADTVLAQQITQLAGVAQVFIAGEQKRAVRVQVDPAKLAAMGLTLEDVRSVLVNATVNAPKGTIDTPQRSLALYDNDQMTQASEYENVILGWKSGAPIRVKDIGRAIDAPENAYLGGLQNGQRGIILMVFKQPGANVIDTVERIKAKLPALEAAIPPSIKVSRIVDRTQTIRASVADVQFTLLLSISLVVMVIFLFLSNVGPPSFRRSPRRSR
jgi:multidrug efflux pump subunit AcrB